MNKTEIGIVLGIILLLILLLVPAVNEAIKISKEQQKKTNQTYTVTVDDVKYPHCMVKEGQIVLEDRKTILVPGQFSTLKITLEN